MAIHRLPLRLAFFGFAVAGIGIAGIENARSAPPAFATEHLESLHRKSLAEYDREIELQTAAPSQDARNAFISGLAALDSHDFAAARTAFTRSNENFPTYVATFNAALTHQLEGSFYSAQKLYSEAQALQPQDGELLVNLGLALLRLEEFKRALATLQKALDVTATNAGDTSAQGRVLLHLALAQSSVGEWELALETLQRADEAFAMSADQRGRAVVAAKRGVVLINHGRPENGAMLLRDAAMRLDRLGADVDEASARTDLAQYHLGAELWDETAAQLEQSVHLAKQARNPLQSGRALNNLGSCRVRQGRLAEAAKNYQEAIEDFRRAQDRIGEAEATNNLGIVLLKEQQESEAFDQFDQSVRLYRKAGARQRAFDKSLTVAEEFGARDQPERAEYFLEIAQSLGSEDMDLARQGALLLARGRYHLSVDLGRAEVALREAQRIFDELHDADKSAEAARLLGNAAALRNTQQFRTWLFGAAGLFLILSALFAHKRIADYAVGFGRTFGTRARAVWRAYRALRGRWLGPEPDRSPEEEAAVRRLERFQRRMVWLFIVLTIFLVLAIDFTLLTLPHLRYVLDSKATVAHWPLPPNMEWRLQVLLNWCLFFVVAHLVVQVLVFAAGVCGALLAYRAVEYAVFRVLRRVSRPFGRELDLRFRTRYLETALARQRWLAPMVLTMLVGAPVAYFWVDAIRYGAVMYGGWLVLAAVAIIELQWFLAVRREVRSLALANQPAAFDWLHRSSRHRVMSLMLNMLIFAYIMVPLLNYGARTLQTWLIHSSFQKTNLEFADLLFESVKKYGTFALEGDSGLLFTRLERAYDPRAGAGQLWDEFLWPILPFLFLAWTCSFFFRLVLPLALSLGGWRGFWNLAGISICVTLTGTAFKEVSTRAFHLDSQSIGVWLGMIVVGLMFTLYLRQAINSETEQIVECGKCRARNPRTASYCQECGHKLQRQPD